MDVGSIAVLEARTEGWIAGLQMAALSMRNRGDIRGFIEDFSGTNRHILDYLLEEVLSREPEEVQAFLLQTAILNRLAGPLCDAVTGAADSQEMLESLERRNLFVVPLDDERTWYRYHHLFADLLQARLHRSGPDVVRRLQSRAAEWCAHNGQIVEAVDYALAARDFERAAGLIEVYWADATARRNRYRMELAERCQRTRFANTLPLASPIAGCSGCRSKTGAIEPHPADAERTVCGAITLGADDEAWAGLPLNWRRCARLSLVTTMTFSRYHTGRAGAPSDTESGAVPG